MKDQFYRIITILAAVAYFVPVLIVVFKKLWKDMYFLYLGIYWLVGAVVNTISNIPGIGHSTLEVVTILYNMIDIPFVLWILWYTCLSSSLAKLLKVIIAAYIIIELILVFSQGLNFEAIKYTIGIGVLIVLITLVWEITMYLKQIEHTNREKSMLFIYAALLFEYGSYIIIYIFDYYIPVVDRADIFLVYYISTLIAITIACFGFLLKKNKQSLAYK